MWHNPIGPDHKNSNCFISFFNFFNFFFSFFSIIFSLFILFLYFLFLFSYSSFVFDILRCFQLVPRTMIGYIICAFVFTMPVYNFLSKSWLFGILLGLQLFVYQLIYKLDQTRIVWRCTVRSSVIDCRPTVLYILYPLLIIFLVYLLGKHYVVYQKSSIIYDRTRLNLDLVVEFWPVYTEFSNIVMTMMKWWTWVC